MDDPVIGKVIGNYVITGRLGEGGMGVVYKAHLVDDKEMVVALKMLKKEHFADKIFLNSLRAEAKILFKMNHPNIVRFLNWVDSDLGICLVVEFVEGRTFAERMSGGKPMSVDEAVTLIRQVLIALQYAHSLNCVHRDLSCNNVMLTRSYGAKVMDFGLAKLQEASSSTKTVAVIRTPGYESPEHSLGLGYVKERSDLFCVGILLYEALTGKNPWKSEFKPPQSLVPSLPTRLSDVIMKALERPLESRFQSAEEMIKALDECQASANRRFSKRTQFVTAFMVIGIIVVFFVFIVPRLPTKSESETRSDTLKTTPPTENAKLHTNPNPIPVTVPNSKQNIGPNDSSQNKDGSGRPEGGTKKSVPPTSGDAENLEPKQPQGEATVQSTPEAKRPCHDPNFVLRVEGVNDGYKEGESITMEVFSTQNCYLNIFYLTANGTVNHIFPNKGDQNNFLQRGVKINLPGTNSYSFRLQLPYGKDKTSESLLIIATKEAADFPFGEVKTNIGVVNTRESQLEELNSWKTRFPCDKYEEVAKRFVLYK